MNLTMSSSNMPIDVSSCDRQEIRFPGAIMPHGTLIVLDKRSHNVVACAENICDYLELTGKYAGDIKRLLPEAIWLQLRKHTGDYLDRYTLANGVVIDIHANSDEHYMFMDIERLFGPAELSRENPMALLRESRALQARVTPFEEERDVRQVTVNTIREIIGYDMVQFLLVRGDGTMQTVAESSNGHYQSFLDKRFPRSDVPDPARKNIEQHDMIYVPDIDYTPMPLISFSDEIAPKDINLSCSSLRSLSPMCNRFYLNVGVHAKLAMTVSHKNKVWGMVIAWNSKAKYISPKHRMLCRHFLDAAAKHIIVNREIRARNTFITQSNYVDDFLDELQRKQAPDKGYANLANLLLKILPCCGAAVITPNSIYKAGLCPENDQLKSKAPSIRVLTVQNDNAAFYIQEPYKLVRLSGFMALPLILEGSYVAIFRREEVETVTWAGDPKKPVSVDEVSGIKRLSPRGSFQAWKEEVKHNAVPWERVDIDIFQRLVNGLNSLLGTTALAETPPDVLAAVTTHPSVASQGTDSRLQITGNTIAERTLRNTLKQLPKLPSALIIESDFLSAAHLEDLLAEAGITAETPPNPKHIESFIEKRQYDLIFIATDNQNVDWQHLIERIKREHQATHIVALCNRKPLHVTSKDMIFAFLTRPILAAELYQTVINCCS